MAGPSFSAFQQAISTETIAQPSAVPAPIDQFRVMAGLRFDLFGAQTADLP
jgi:hypothetical protein